MTIVDTPQKTIENSQELTKLDEFVLPFPQQYSRWTMGVSLLIIDVFSIALSFTVAILIRSSINKGIVVPEYYLRSFPLIVLFIGVYASKGLYPGVGLSPVEELRRLSSATSIVFLMLTALTFWVRFGDIYSRLAIGFAWILALFFVQINRWLLRIIFVQLGLWGESVAVVGYGPQGERITEFLLNNLRLSLKPVLIINGFNNYDIPSNKIPKVNLDNSYSELYPKRIAGIRTAVVITSEVPQNLLSAIIEKNRFGFQRLILISDLQDIGSVGVIAHDLEGYLGLEVRRNLLNPWQRRVKRLIDISLVVTGGMLLSPVFLLICILIKLDSKGGILYSQERIGLYGRKFRMWKFRTMVTDAENIIRTYLEAHPEMHREWKETQKLRDDPRITRVGKILRKLSLDELPQLYNVLIGDMSLVGPRPFFAEQMGIYGKSYHLYTKVRPGMTGMWQVSGRNWTSFSERAQWDEYYVRQWSIWLDIYIMMRTIWVVLRQDGAF